MFRKMMLSLALGAAAVAGSAGAQTRTPPSAVYVLGDSLSDRGNLASALGYSFPAPPFYKDSFTNGDVAVQVMAQRFGLSAEASFFATGFVDTRNPLNPSGTNYAVAGATAGLLQGQGVTNGNLPFQVAALTTRLGGALPTDALYTVFIGGNDVRTAANNGATNDGFDQSYITEGVAAERNAINTLVAAGARNVLVVNVPDVGAIPEFRTGASAGRAAGATAASLAYNAGLADVVTNARADFPTASIRLFDLYSYASGINANPGAFGLTNTTVPCYPRYNVVTRGPAPAPNAACGEATGPGGYAANIDSFLYWDEIHPTAVVHRAFGNALADFVLAADVPEPATWLTMVLGFGAAGGAVRRRRVAVKVRYAA